jgi:hypothetical protein
MSHSPTSFERQTITSFNWSDIHLKIGGAQRIGKLNGPSTRQDLQMSSEHDWAKLREAKLGPGSAAVQIMAPKWTAANVPAQNSKCAGGSVKRAFYRGALVPIFEAPLLQRVRPIFQDFPGRHFRLNRSREFLALKAVKGMQSGQESVVLFIPVLTHNDSNCIPLQFYNICVGHSSILASKAPLNP